MGKDDIKIDGKKEAALLLAGLDEGHREKILGEIAARDPALAEVLRKGLIQFETLLALDSMNFQTLMKSLPPRLLALSLRGLPEETLTAFYSKFSERFVNNLKEEISLLGPQKLSDVKAAREKMAEIAVNLKAQGVITFNAK